MNDDPQSNALGRRDSDEYREELGRLIVFAEQLEQISLLLLNEGNAKGRMALVALDNLAELVLFRHAERVFDSRDMGPLGFRQPRFSDVQRRRIRDSFGRKVQLGMQPATHEFSFHDDEAVLDESDAAVFRVAHLYRNDVYHADRHNSGLLIPLGKLYWHAVARAWTRLEPPSRRWSSRLPDALPRLRRLGYLRKHETPVDWFDNRTAASEIASHLGTNLNVTKKELADLLVTDLTERVAATRDEHRSIGIEDAALKHGLWWNQFWEQASQDEDLIQLEAAREALWRRMLAKRPASQDDTSAFVAADEACNARLAALADHYEAAVTVETLADIQRLGGRLPTAKTVADLLMRYQPLDAKLAVLESITERAAIQMDQYVQLETDILLGK